MAIKFTTTDVAGFANGIKFLVYGDSGTGKTTLAGSFAEGETLIITTENGCLSIRHKKHQLAEIETLEDLKMLLTALETNAEGYQHFKNIVLDSVSDIGETILSSMKLATKDPRQAYGRFEDEFKPCVKGFRDLIGRNVLVIAKQEFVVDATTNVSTYGPSMPWKKMSADFPYLFDEVLALCVGQSEGQTFRYLRTARDVQWVGKDRSGSLDAVEYSPDMPTLINKILTTQPKTQGA